MVKVLAGGHHDGSTAHGYAMENDFRLRVLMDDPLDPLGNIFFIKPAHADVFALADSVRAVVGQQYMISLLIENRAVGQHEMMAVFIAVDGNNPPMSVGVMHTVFCPQD